MGITDNNFVKAYSVSNCITSRPDYLGSIFLQNVLSNNTNVSNEREENVVNQQNLFRNILYSIYETTYYRL